MGVSILFLFFLLDNISGITTRIETQIDLVKIDVDNRVKAIKEELDVLNEQFQNQLDSSKIELIK
jgi:hypothetical protein